MVSVAGVGRRVGFGGDAGGGLFAELDVPTGATQVQVPGLGLKLEGDAAVDDQVLERGVPQLVERPRS